MAKLNFSPKAAEDLSEIKKYISNELQNTKAAHDTISGILNRVKKLCKFPRTGAKLSSIFDIDTEYRFLVCNNYLAFYRIENDEVHIIRILYAKRDYLRALFADSEHS